MGQTFLDGGGTFSYVPFWENFYHMTGLSGRYDDDRLIALSLFSGGSLEGGSLFQTYQKVFL